MRLFLPGPSETLVARAWGLPSAKYEPKVHDGKWWLVTVNGSWSCLIVVVTQQTNDGSTTGWGCSNDSLPNMMWLILSHDWSPDSNAVYLSQCKRKTASWNLSLPATWSLSFYELRSSTFATANHRISSRSVTSTEKRHQLQRDQFRFREADDFAVPGASAWAAPLDNGHMSAAKCRNRGDEEPGRSWNFWTGHGNFWKPSITVTNVLTITILSSSITSHY